VASAGKGKGKKKPPPKNGRFLAHNAKAENATPAQLKAALKRLVEKTPKNEEK
jgi:hypothetical protein